MKLNMINCALLALLLLVPMVLLICTNFPLVIHFLRPIISSIVTFNYNLACFLCDLLSPLVPDDYSDKDIFSFVSQIKNANLFRKVPVSYHVTRLFTNIPLQETIDRAINLIFNHNLNITKKQLEKLFLFAISQTHVIFNSNGVAMGSPLVLVLANNFMGFYKSKWTNEYILTNKHFTQDMLMTF